MTLDAFVLQLSNVSTSDLKGTMTSTSISPPCFARFRQRRLRGPRLRGLHHAARCFVLIGELTALLLCPNRGIVVSKLGPTLGMVEIFQNEIALIRNFVGSSPEIHVFLAWA